MNRRRSHTKVHHSAIDGASGNELTVALLDLSPDIAVHEPEEEWVPDRIPTEVELLGYAANSLARQPVRAAKAVRRTAEAALTLRRRNREPDIDPPPGIGDAPATSFNGSLTPRRSFAFTSLPLPEVKELKNALGATVNDVVLALCGGALRTYLEQHDEHHDESLVAMVPVSVRADDERSDMGNRISSLLCTLATDVDDPIARLARIHDGMREAKEQHRAIGADTLTDWAEFAAPALLGRAARLYSRTRMADRHRPIFNVTISNVPGPPFDLYCGGARMRRMYPLGPIMEGGGLNMTVMSYKDGLDFGLHACPDLIPDLWSIADALDEALGELRDAAAAAVAADEPRAPEPAPAKRATKKKAQQRRSATA